MDERRKHRRVALAVPGKLTRAGSANEWVQVVNASEAALLARGPSPFASGQRATVSVFLPEGPFSCEAVCVRATAAPPWEGAFLFTAVAEDARHKLAGFLASLHGGPGVGGAP
jgi:hypothetical protein